ncbi:MAG TPA: dienelactone hydrolase family protein [Chloroflexia bacterium]|nr:dienelactone hydrolase family protein [Chloroflexia bacterium]
MGQFVEFDSNGDAVRAYLSSQGDEKKPGILLCHAWWGLNDFFVGLADRLSAEGYTVLAPDLFGGHTAITIPEAEALATNLEQDGGEKAITIEQAALDYLLGLPNVAGNRVGAIGFSLGAAYAGYLAALRPEVAAVVVFYGGPYYGGEGGYAGHTHAATQGHFALNDDYEPVEPIREVEADLKKAGKAVDFYFYPDSGHWFFESNRPDAYNAAAAQLAWERTLVFLHSILKEANNA